MMGIPFGVVVEGLVSILLLITIGYSILLNERLKRLHADRNALKNIVADLVQATDKANSAIRELRQTTNDAEMTLSARLNEADRFAVELANHVTSGQAVMERIAKIIAVSRRSADMMEPLPGLPASRVQEALKRLRTRQLEKGEAA